MKAIKLNIKMLSYLAAFLMVFTISACDDDEKSGTFESSSLEALVTEAEGLIANSEEGINAGDFKPGAKAELQTVVDWVLWTIERADDQEDLSDAAVKLQRYIDIFKANTVAVAIPWIQQENDTYIQISDNIKTTLGGEWTIELKCYIVDLNTKGYSNNLFSAEQMGPDSGFGARYFGDGKIQIVTGNSNWVDSGDQAGPGTLVAGVWMDVTMTSTGTHHELFINGSKVAEVDNTHLLAADAPFVIGNSPTWTDRVCNTLVKDFRVWNSVLDESTIDANRTATFDGTEAGLECYFPFGSDLGESFVDVTGKYTATIKGKVEWVSAPPVIVLDKSKLTVAIKEITDFKASVIEGNEDGDYPVGTIAYIDELIADANDVFTNGTQQAQLDEMIGTLSAKIVLINSMVVADTDGIFIDRDNADAVGLRITPNYTPQANYTVEFEVNVKSLFGYGNADLVNNGQYGIWVYGYEELTEENVLGSGGLRNFTRKADDSGWETGPTAPALTIKTNNWHHIAVTHDENVGGFPITIMYVDGVETGRDTIEAPAISGWGETWLGNGWGKMDGSIRNFRLWDEARAELNADVIGDESSLKMYFPLDRVKGVVFKDETGNFDAEMKGISWNVDED